MEPNLENKVVAALNIKCRGVILGKKKGPYECYMKPANKPEVNSLIIVYEDGETEIRCPYCKRHTSYDFCEMELTEQEIDQGLEEKRAVCIYSSRYD